MKAGRSVQWLEQHGTCIDNIRIQPSKVVASAQERGAYAKRSMKVGSTISISLIIHMDRSQIDIVQQQPYDTSKPIIPLISTSYHQHY